MPKISALLHVRDSEATLGRALETLRVCDEIVVVDHHSTDNSAKVCKEYGAILVEAVSGVEKGAYATDCKHDWVFCVLPNESISESLEAALHEWKESKPVASAYAVHVREEIGSERRNGGTQTRLVNRTCVNWTAELPANITGAPVIHGELLHFTKESS